MVFIAIFAFITGTTTLHLLGVVIGHLSIKNNISLILLRLTGISFARYLWDLPAWCNILNLFDLIFK